MISTRALRPVVAIGLVAALTSACGSGGGGSPTSPQPRATALALSDVPILRAGQTVQLVATATLADGSTQTVTHETSYQTSEPRVATVSAHGVVTAVSNGISTVTASYHGVTASVIVHVFVSPPPQGLAAHAR